MPGGRLTHHDRQRIATGLADRLSYTEIARQLGRPTSTISREVARNGGSRHYQAERAHDATRRRARRTPSERPAGRTADTSGRDPAVVREFQERFAAMMIETGLPAMPAKVLTCLTISDSGDLTVADLTRRLAVSPGTISKAVRYLERIGLVRRERDPGRRRERYVFDADVWDHAWSVSMRSIATWAETAQQGADILGRTTPAGARLAQVARFHELIHEDMARLARHWRRVLTE